MLAGLGDPGPRLVTSVGRAIKLLSGTGRSLKRGIAILISFKSGSVVREWKEGQDEKLDSERL